MKRILVPLLLLIAFVGYSQKACNIFTLEDFSKATFLQDAELKAFMESKGFVLVADSSTEAAIYTYTIVPKSTNANPQKLILKRYGSRTYLCSPQDAVMLSYVTLLESNILFSGVGSYSTTTTYTYNDILINVEQYKEKSVKYGRYFMNLEYNKSSQ